MRDFSERSVSGEQFMFSGQVTKPAVAGQAPPWPNYPANAAGVILTFYAKRQKQDVAALVTRVGVLQNGGAWTVQIQAADTAGFTKSEELTCEVWMTELDGTQTQVAKGTWEVEKRVGP